MTEQPHGATEGDNERVSGVCTECGAAIHWALGASQVQCSYCGGGLAIESGMRPVRLQCPVCSGNFHYIDGTMAGSCPYCDTALLALTRDRLLRFVIPPRPEVLRELGEGIELELVPFWQLTGLLYGCEIGKRHRRHRMSAADQSPESASDPTFHRVVDGESSLVKEFDGRVVHGWVADPSASALGVKSLGLRAALFPMEPFGAQHEQLGRVVPPSLDYATASEMLYQNALDLSYAADGMQIDCRRADLTASAISLLYYPFAVRRSGQAIGEAWDAVTGAGEALGRAGEPLTPERPTAFDELKLLELRCERCRDPLKPGNHAVVFPCRPCRTFWAAEKEGLKPFDAHYARPQIEPEPGGEQAKRLWLPFWQVHTELSYRGKQAAQVGELRKVVGVRPPPGSPAGAAETAPLSYFAPAYGALRAPRLDYAARDMTRLQPQLEATDEAEGELFTCFFGPEDAQALAYVVWLQLLPGALARNLRTLRIRCQEVHLWYVPFADEDRELVNLLTGVRYDRTAFRGVAH